MTGHGIDDLVPAGTGLQHRRGHVAERAEQAVAVLQLSDQALRGERASDQLGARLQHLVGRRRAPDGGEAVAAEQHQVAVRVVGLAQRVRRDRVKVGLGGRVAQGFLEHCVPRYGWIAALDLRGCRHPQMRGDELEV